MSFSLRLLLFFFGIIIGLFIIRFIFSHDKISKIQKGYSDYFKGNDKVANYLANQVYLKDELGALIETEIDSAYYNNLIRNSEINILSRKPCFEYVVTPYNNNKISNFLVKKCDKLVYVDKLNFKENY